MTLKFIVDEALSPSTAAYLCSLGHDAIHAHDRLPVGSPDADVVRLAAQEGRVILTADLDYGYLLVTAATPPSAVILRLEQTTTTLVNQMLTKHLPHITVPLREGALIVIEVDDVRIRRLPSAAP